MQKKDRAPELDFLRCVAILLVLFRHVLFIPENLPLPIQAFFIKCKEFGWMGVDLFFVLSGFLVSGLLFSEYQKNNTIRPFLFLIRRAMKLYPAFYAFLLISLPLQWLAGIAPFSLKGVMGELLFLQNYLGSSWAHTWSLAVEEHFYVFLVIGLSVMGAMSRKNRDIFKTVPLLCLGICFLITAERAVLAYQYSFGWKQILTKTHFRADSLLFGVFLSYEYHFNRDRFVALFRENASWILAGCLVCISPVLILGLEDPLSPVTASGVEEPFIVSMGLSLLYVGFGGLIALLITWQGEFKRAVFERLSVFTFLGRHSYSIYLWHYGIYAFTIRIVRELWGYDFFFWEMLFYMGGTFLIGVSMSLLVEQPFLRLRDRYFPSRGGSLAAGDARPSAPASPVAVSGEAGG